MTEFPDSYSIRFHSTSKRMFVDQKPKELIGNVVLAPELLIED